MGAKNSTHYHKHHHYNHCDVCPRSPSNRDSSVGQPSRTSSHPSNYRLITDEFDSLEQVSQALQQAGLESSNLIIGVDFTKSNAWTGMNSFKGKNLHHLGDCLNPYEQAISIIGRTLSGLDEDNRIPCYGFGDATTCDQQVFSFHLGDRPCQGFEEVLFCYRERVPHVQLGGPTSFAPIIRNAIRIVNDSGGQYHILMIIADGQITRSVDTPDGQLSPQEESTIDALVEASKYPLSVVLVGVGDGPWDQMYECDDHIPDRAFDNFQFVNFTEIMSKDIPPSKKETDFALHSLMEVPFQYKATMSLHLLGRQRETIRPFPVPLPPPIRSISLNSSPSNRESPAVGFTPPPSENSVSPFRRAHSNRLFPAFGLAPFPPSEVLTRSLSISSSSSFNKICSVCFLKDKELVFGCGHQTCSDCGNEILFCPTCRTQITIKITLRE